MSEIDYNKMIEAVAPLLEGDDETPQRSLLRQKLDAVVEESGCSLKDLTVLATQNDPFRIDTPARHRDGEWLAITAQELGLGERPIHLRGLHYMVLGREKPDGTPYANTEDDWLWLSAAAGKAARYLGYIPFDQIIDQRNEAPTVHIFEEPYPQAYLNIDLDVLVPDVQDMEPRIGVDGFDGVQPYKLVYAGEKSSLKDVLGPVATEYKADLYLPTGEMSDTMIYQMAKIGAEDGRPMVVLYFSDCDPSGWQMPISVGRKLQAFKEGWFPGLEFEVYRAALTPEQVAEYGLPCTPLKATERRADRWQKAMGIEQTEIDALASLNPRLLRKVARAATDPFFDKTLASRVFDAQGRWMDEAQAIINESTSTGGLEEIREQAAEKLDEMREQVEELTEQLRVDVDDFDLPAFDIPTAELNGNVHGTPLVDSRWSFREQCRALIDAKTYGDPRSTAADDSCGEWQGDRR